MNQKIKTNIACVLQLIETEFCASERKGLEKPFRVGSRIYASNGRCAVRIDIDPDAPGLPEDDGQYNQTAATLDGHFEPRSDGKTVVLKVDVAALTSVPSQYAERLQKMTDEWKPNQKKRDVLTCPCCGNELYLEHTSFGNELLDKSEEDDRELLTLSDRLCIKIKRRRGDLYFKGQNITSAFRLAALADDTAFSSFVTADKDADRGVLRLVGNGWSVVAMCRYIDSDDRDDMKMVEDSLLATLSPVEAEKPEE